MTTTYIYPPLDASPDDLYAGFVNQMQVFYPGWQPNGLDDFIAKAVSLIAAQLTEVSADVATSIFRYFGAYIAGLPPVSASPAQSTCTFVALDTLGHTIPAGEDVTWADSSGNTWGFTTQQQAVIPAGQTTVSGVPILADIPGTGANGLTGSFTGLTPALAWVQSVTLDSVTTGGMDAEDDSTYLNRLRSLFTTLSPKPITVSDFGVIAAQQSGVSRATCVDGYLPAATVQTATTTSGSVNLSVASPGVSAIPAGVAVSGTNIAPGTFVTNVYPAQNLVTLSTAATGSGSPSLTFAGSLLNGGTIGVWVQDANGNAPSASVVQAVQTTLGNGAIANLAPTVYTASYTTITVAVTAYCYGLAAPAAVQAQIQGTINSLLNAANWGQPTSGQPVAGATSWSNQNVLRIQRVQQAILSIPGVDYVASVTLNGQAADLYIPGVVPLPLAGTPSVTVLVGNH